MDITTVIIVKGGMVTDVYSTLPSVNHDIEVIDLDSTGQESSEEIARKERFMKEVMDSEEYYPAY